MKTLKDPIKEPDNEPKEKSELSPGEINQLFNILKSKNKDFSLSNNNNPKKLRLSAKNKDGKEIVYFIMVINSSNRKDDDDSDARFIVLVERKVKNYIEKFRELMKVISKDFPRILDNRSPSDFWN